MWTWFQHQSGPSDSPGDRGVYQALTGHHERLVVHKPFVCPLCERGFSIKLDSLVHLVTEACTRADRSLRRVTGGWECISCDKGYSSRDLSERHTRSHENDQGISCPVCRKDFTGYKGTLLNHVKDTHPEYFDNLGCWIQLGIWAINIFVLK